MHSCRLRKKSYTGADVGIRPFFRLRDGLEQKKNCPQSWLQDASLSGSTWLPYGGYLLNPKRLGGSVAWRALVWRTPGTSEVLPLRVAAS